MIISIFGIVVSLVVFIGVKLIFAALPIAPTNQAAYEILVYVIALVIISLIFSLRAFWKDPNGKLRNPAFHRYFFRTIIMNAIIAAVLYFVL